MSNAKVVEYGTKFFMEVFILILRITSKVIRWSNKFSQIATSHFSLWQRKPGNLFIHWFNFELFRNSRWNWKILIWVAHFVLVQNWDPTNSTYRVNSKVVFHRPWFTSNFLISRKKNISPLLTSEWHLTYVMHPVEPKIFPTFRIHNKKWGLLFEKTNLTFKWLWNSKSPILSLIL